MDDRPDPMVLGLSGPPGRPPGLLARIAAGIALCGVFVATLMFSVVVFAAILSAGVVAAGWFWWRTREIRRVLREEAGRAGQMDGRRPDDRRGIVIEGETLHEEIERDTRR